MYPNPDIIRINPTFAAHLDGKESVKPRKQTPVKNRNDFNETSAKPAKVRVV